MLHSCIWISLDLGFKLDLNFKNMNNSLQLSFAITNFLNPSFVRPFAHLVKFITSFFLKNITNYDCDDNEREILECGLIS